MITLAYLTVGIERTSEAYAEADITLCLEERRDERLLKRDAVTYLISKLRVQGAYAIPKTPILPYLTSHVSAN
jgi:hypothetical protein